MSYVRRTEAFSLTESTQWNVWVQWNDGWLSIAGEVPCPVMHN